MNIRKALSKVRLDVTSNPSGPGGCEKLYLSDIEEADLGTTQTELK